MVLFYKIFTPIKTIKIFDEKSRGSDIIETDFKIAIGIVQPFLESGRPERRNSFTSSGLSVNRGDHEPSASCCRSAGSHSRTFEGRNSGIFWIRDHHRPKSFLSYNVSRDLDLVSRHHARIVREGARFKLIRSATQGTLVNGKLVGEAYLKGGDVLEFAQGGPKVSFMILKGQVYEWTQA